MNTITCNNLKIITESKTPVLVLDIRESLEFRQFNIGGKNYSLEVMQRYGLTDEVEKFKDELVVICCSSMSGKRSEKAKAILEKAGFQNVKILAGGIYTWRRIFPNLSASGGN